MWKESLCMCPMLLNLSHEVTIIIIVASLFLVNEPVAPCVVWNLSCENWTSARHKCFHCSNMGIWNNTEQNKWQCVTVLTLVPSFSLSKDRHALCTLMPLFPLCGTYLSMPLVSVTWYNVPCLVSAWSGRKKVLVLSSAMQQSLIVAHYFCYIAGF